MFISNPDPYSLPTYRIGTFVTQSISRNHLLDKSYEKNAVEYFNLRFGENNWLITSNGREAIDIAMQQLALPKEKSTTILTTSGNFYISGCVTSTLQKYTKWDREKTPNTAAYFVNHEFGYPYSNMEELVKIGLPIIEDCCTTFFSQDAKKSLGKYGNFAVYSFPKFFSIQIGGLLVGRGIGFDGIINETKLSFEEREHILKVVGYELSFIEDILDKRQEIFKYASQIFENIGFTLRFASQENVVPSALLLNNNGIIKQLQQLKDFLNAHGIQNSVFYGEDAFFIPNHNMLTHTDIDYFTYVIKQFLKFYNDNVQH